MVKSDESDDEAGKIFVGGLSWETTQEKLQEYFTLYGEVTDCVIMKNTETGKSRGFGFVTFKDAACVAKVLSSGPHEVDNRTIDPKVCNSKDSQQNKKSGQYPKIFLGGLPPNTTETDLRSFFSRYGTVVEVVLMYDQEKKKSRGFGFVSFETEDSCKRVCAEHFVKINGKKIECKHAEPRDKKRPAQQTGTAPQQWTGMGPSGWGPPGNTPSGSQGPNMGPGVPGPMGPPMNNAPMMGPPGYQGGWGPGPYGAPGGWGPQPGYGPGYGWGYGPGYGPPGPGYGQPGYGGYGYGGYGYGGPMGGPPPPNPPAPGTENFPANSGGQNNNANNSNPNNPPASNNNGGNNNNNNNNPNSGNQPGQSPPGMGNYNQESSNFGPQRGQAFGSGYSGGSNSYGGSGNYPQNSYGNQGENQGNRSGGSQGNQGPGSHGYHPYHR